MVLNVRCGLESRPRAFGLAARHLAIKVKRLGVRTRRTINVHSKEEAYPGSFET